MWGSNADRRFPWRRSVGALVTLLATTSLAALSPTAQAGAEPADAEVVAPSASAPVVRGDAPRTHPAAPAPGDMVTFTGRTRTAFARTVRLQRRTDGVWRTVARARSTRSGAYRLSRPVATAGHFRVEAPRARRPGTSRPAARWRSPAVRVVPGLVATTLTVDGESWSEPGTEAWTADVRPVEAGRRVTVEVLEHDAWVAVGEVRQGTQARVTLPTSTLAPGGHLLRVTAQPTRRLATSESVHPLTVLEPAAPDPVARGTLPRVDVVTEDGQDVLSKTDYSRAQITLDASGTTDGSGAPLASAAVGGRLRVRGNSTSWAQVKLPYKVKLDERTSLLGMPASKDWVLLANFYDRSLMRNAAAFHAARRIGVEWSPRMYDVEVWLNGTYRGVYQLGEGIEVEPGRVDLGADELPEDPADGGFLLEADHWPDTDPSFVTTQGIQIYLKEGGADTQAYLDQVAAQIQAFEDVLYSEEFLDPVHGYRPLVGLEEIADWYLVNELTKNVESNFGTSVWIKRDVGGPLTMGPPWDHDQSAGYQTAFGVDDPEGWFLHHGPLKPGVERSPGMADGPEGSWINRMLKDPVFRDLVKQRWQRISPRLHALVPDLAAHADRIQAAAERNFAPRAEGGAGQFLGPTILDGGTTILHHTTWRPHADTVVTWYAQRIAWLDRAMPTLGSDTLP
ncbi:MAG: CotH kinase family protein [Nocardioides sp.]|uniref:CotH kinase family protein n=1 Tax=Nocardioides sp. TaxID=35761 RepID=UPI003F044484